MMFAQYPKYKGSGIEWLGEIPEEWEILQIKRLSLVKRGASPRPIDDPKYFDEDGEYAWVRIADVTASDRYLERTTQRLSSLGKSLSVPLEPGDIFLSIAGSVGKPIISKIKCCIHDGFVYFPNYKNNSEYLYYVFASGQVFYGLGKMGTQLNLNTDTVGGIYIGLPTVKDQELIVSFLDRETEKIDILISKKERQIELLQEKRSALISHAVTKGLPAEAAAKAGLDPDVKMKDSGVEWLGEIPEGWEVKKLKYVARLRSGDTITSSDIDVMGDYPVYGGNGLRGYTAAYTHEGDYVLIGRQGALCGCINYAVGRFWASEHAVVATPINKTVVRWLGELLNSMNLNQYSQSAAQPGLAVDTITALALPVPSITEQIAIASFLDRETEKIDTLIEKIKISIEKLREYRMALISAAVTGKIDVREEEK